MSPRSVSRWLAPLALLVSLLAVLLVITGSTSDEESDDGATPTTEERREARQGSTGTNGTGTSGRTSTTSRRRTYTVRPGDTLALISERTGVSVEELLELNDDIDPNSLTVGDKIRLTE